MTNRSIASLIAAAALCAFTNAAQAQTVPQYGTSNGLIGISQSIDGMLVKGYTDRYENF